MNNAIITKLGGLEQQARCDLNLHPQFAPSATNKRLHDWLTLVPPRCSLSSPLLSSQRSHPGLSMMDSLAPMIMDDKAFYDIGEHELLDVWDTDLNTQPIGGPFVGHSPPSSPLSSASTPSSSITSTSPFFPTDSLVSGGRGGTSRSPLWSMSSDSSDTGASVANEIVRNDRLLTDTSSVMFPYDTNLAVAHAASPGMESESLSTLSNLSHMGSMIKREPGNLSKANRSTIGSDGDSLPDSPSSMSEEMETDGYHYLALNPSLTSQAGLGTQMETLPTSSLGASQPASIRVKTEISDTLQANDLSPSITNINVVDDLESSNLEEDGFEDGFDDNSDEDEDMNHSSSSFSQDAVPSLVDNRQRNNISVQCSNGNNIGYIIKQEPGSPLRLCNAQSLLKPSTIVFTTKNMNGSSNRYVIPKVNIKVNPNGAITTTHVPSSTSLGASGIVPTIRATTTTTVVNNTPIQSTTGRTRNVYGHSTRQPIQTPLISNQPKGSTGPLTLTEEEKRTLLSEGYPVPQRLPLSKQEEKSLKKIRRKIKNKISAQESRRKKKEYMDCLERKMDSLHAELSQYKAKCVALEGQNSTLVAQVKKLQCQLGAKNGFSQCK